MKISNAVDPIEANALRGGLLSLRDSLVVSSQTLISNGCGASVGLDAAYTQIGSGAASLIGQFFNLRRNDMRLIVGGGSAGAIAAAFGAPITGAFYACKQIVGVYSVGSAAQWYGRSPISWQSAGLMPNMTTNGSSTPSRMRAWSPMRTLLPHHVLWLASVVESA
jgi:H+/Cl- antiporter ClcA